MNLGETAKLIIQLDLKGNAAAGIRNISQKLGDLDRQVNGRISGGLKTIGAGLGVAFINASRIAIGAVGAIGTAVLAMAREGQEAAKSHAIFTTAIANSGQVSAAYVKVLKDQQLALLNLSGVDDELIEAEQTKLVQMGLTGEAVAKLTPLILDLSTATGIDLLTATTAVGKAANGSAGSLQRYGVFVDKAKFKIDPLAATMEALNQKFQGTTEALSGSLEVRLKVFNELLANVREEAGIKLLPTLTRLVTVAGTKLVPAFSKFIDRILPDIISGIDKFSDILESGGVERGINAITDAVGPMIEVLKLAVGPVQALVKAFLALPQGVQAGLISGFLINKLSGGLVASGVKEVVGGIASLAGPSLGAAFSAALTKIGFTRGATPANPLFVSQVGGLPGLPGAVPGAAGAAGALGTAAVAGAVAFAASGIGVAILRQMSGDPNVVGGGKLGFFPGQGPGPGMIGYHPPNSDPTLRNFDRNERNKPLFVTVVGATTGGKSIGDRDEMRSSDMAGILRRGLAAGFHPGQQAVENTYRKNVQHKMDLATRATERVRAAVAALPGGIAAALHGFVAGQTFPGKDKDDAPFVPRPGQTPAGGSTVNPATGFVVKVTQSIKDVNTAQDIRGRWSPTASQAGAA